MANAAAYWYGACWLLASGRASLKGQTGITGATAHWQNRHKGHSRILRVDNSEYRLYSGGQVRAELSAASTFKQARHTIFKKPDRMLPDAQGCR
eukprot:4173608-Pleurochrysis_carterae.AAC.1